MTCSCRARPCRCCRRGGEGLGEPGGLLGGDGHAGCPFVGESPGSSGDVVGRDGAVGDGRRLRRAGRAVTMRLPAVRVPPRGAARERARCRCATTMAPAAPLATGTGRPDEYPLPGASVHSGLARCGCRRRALWHSTVNVWFAREVRMSKLISGQPGEKVHDPTPLGSTRSRALADVVDARVRRGTVTAGSRSRPTSRRRSGPAPRAGRCPLRRSKVCEVLVPPEGAVDGAVELDLVDGRPFVGRFHDQVAPVAPLRRLEAGRGQGVPVGGRRVRDPVRLTATGVHRPHRDRVVLRRAGVERPNREHDLRAGRAATGVGTRRAAAGPADRRERRRPRLADADGEPDSLLLAGVVALTDGVDGMPFDVNDDGLACGPSRSAPLVTVAT